MILRENYKLNEAEVEVIYSFIEGEPADRDYPGAKDSIEVQKIMFDGIDIYPAICEDCVLEIEEYLTKKHKD